MDTYCVKPGKKVRMRDWDTQGKHAFAPNKEEGLKQLEELKSKLYSLQVRFFAENKHKLLIVLQGMDTAGKDGAIRNVFGGLDPQGIRVATFPKPSITELNHDYLWRIHQQVPSTGEIVIFNRSHYEDVLAVRVRHLMPKAIWDKRFRHINEFERMLVDEGAMILKIFLHISFEEQGQRLLSRKNTPHKQWKLIPQDIEDRKLWPQYTEAYEEALTRTSTELAPWWIVPANRKWYRNLVVASIVHDALQQFNPQYPKPDAAMTALEI